MARHIPQIPEVTEEVNFMVHALLTALWHGAEAAAVADEMSLHLPRSRYKPGSVQITGVSMREEEGIPEFVFAARPQDGRPMLAVPFNINTALLGVSSRLLLVYQPEASPEEISRARADNIVFGTRATAAEGAVCSVQPSGEPSSSNPLSPKMPHAIGVKVPESDVSCWMGHLVRGRPDDDDVFEWSLAYSRRESPPGFTINITLQMPVVLFGPVASNPRAIPSPSGPNDGSRYHATPRHLLQ